MKNILSISLILITSILISQNESDSLLLKVKNYKKQDSIRVEILVDACVGGVFKADTQYMVYAEEALQISENTKYELGKVRSLNCIGNYYFQRDIYDKAIEFYTRAMKLSEKRKDDNNIIISKSNIANVFTHTNKQTKAIPLFKECDQILLKRGDSLIQNRAAILTNLATAYSSISQHDSAIYVYNQVFYICNTIKSEFGLAITLCNLANEYYLTKQYQKALNSSEEALKILDKNHFDFLRAPLYKTFGTTYLELNKIEKGIDYLLKCSDLSREINDQEVLVEVYQKLYKAFYKTNNYKEAYTYAVNYINLNDSILGLQKEKAMAEISTKYETEKKEAAIKELTQEKTISDLQSQRKSVLIYSILGGLIALVLLLYFLFTRYKTKKQNEALKIQLEQAEKTIEAEKKATESELKALKSQMNPHFIFNALNSIQEQFMYGDKLKGNEQLGNFTYLTRQILTVSGRKQIPLSTEMEILSKYLELEKMRFQNDFEYSISFSENIDEDYVQLPPMMIQPFVENSIKHGLLHKAESKKLTIHFNLNEEENYLLCSVEDNGIGRAKSAEIKANNSNKHASFSTSSIEQRLELLNANLKLNNLIVYADVINSNNQIIGTKVDIKIPIL